jgi:hypothetical protein
MGGLEMIPNEAERQQMRARLKKAEREIVELTPDQIANFAGNAIELHNKRGEKLLVLSSRAGGALTEDQQERLSRDARLIALELSTIELGGGSARCMMATIHLPPRSWQRSANATERGPDSEIQRGCLQRLLVLAGKAKRYKC